MTYEEMYREIVRDFSDLMNWAGHRWHKIYRRSLKARIFPFVVRYSWTSARKNEWTFNVLVNGKNLQQRSCNMTYTRMRTDDGDYWMMAHPDMYGSIHVAVFLPHFMARYALRTELDLRGHELADHYFMENQSGFAVDKPQGGHEVCLCTDEGIALGDRLNDRMKILKTFIRYDMSVGWQREAFEKGRSRINNEVLIVSTKNAEHRIGEKYKERNKADKKIF